MHVEQLEISKTPEIAMAAFADSGGSQYLIMTYGLEPDPQDVALGHDCVHLEIGDQSHGNYGAVLDIQIGTNTCTVSFDTGSLGLDPLASPIRLNCPNVSEFSDTQRAILRLLRVNSQRDRASA